MTVTPDLLRQVPIFQNLCEEELVEIVSCFAEAQIQPGAELYREGQAATSACFLVDGELEVVKALPGGGETKVGTIAPGTMIGEMALIAGGARMATIRARRPSTVLSVSYHFFHAALSQMTAPAFKILRAVIRTMTERLDELQVQILELLGCGDFVPGSAARLAEATIRHPASFDFRPFIAVLPVFESFSESEMDGFLDEGEVFEMPRGELLYREGTAPEACYLILRGAIERSVMRDRRYQLSVLGPGRLCGGNALIAKRAHTSDTRMRSGALVVRFDPAAFDHLFAGATRHCLKFQTLFSADQLMQLKASDNLFAQLVSQSHMLRRPTSRIL